VEWELSENEWISEFRGAMGKNKEGRGDYEEKGF
jgi:hypothetical protein